MVASANNFIVGNIFLLLYMYSAAHNTIEYIIISAIGLWLAAGEGGTYIIYTHITYDGCYCISLLLCCVYFSVRKYAHTRYCSTRRVSDYIGRDPPSERRANRNRVHRTAIGEYRYATRD